MLTARFFMFGEKMFVRIVWIFFVAIVVHFLYITQSLSRLPSINILHSNIYFGIDYIGPWYYHYAFPSTGLFIGVVHYMLARILYNKDKMLSYMIIIGALLFELMLFFASIRIININAV